MLCSINIQNRQKFTVSDQVICFCTDNPLWWLNFYITKSSHHSPCTEYAFICSEISILHQLIRSCRNALQHWIIVLYMIKNDSKTTRKTRRREISWRYHAAELRRTFLTQLILYFVRMETRSITRTPSIKNEFRNTLLKPPNKDGIPGTGTA